LGQCRRERGDKTHFTHRGMSGRPGDLQISGNSLHVRLDPASAPRRSKARAALCTELTDTATQAPTLTLAYSIKGRPGTN